MKRTPYKGMPLLVALAVAAGCSGQRRNPAESKQPEPGKVVAEFITMEATTQDLERLGIAGFLTNATPVQQQKE